MADFSLAVQALQRSTWKPRVVEGERSLTCSKFAGTPYLAPAEAHPTCPNCGQPLQLFVQVNLQELPVAVQGEFGAGLLQLFYCINDDPACECDCEAWSPFSTSVLARLIQLEAETAENLTPIASAFPAKTIEGWEEFADLPNQEEQEVLGVTAAEQWAGDPQSGDKLAGYPCWIQGVEYPNCPICDRPMRLVFQLDSEDNLPYMFGDVGCGHITQCLIHKDQVAFGWACC